MRLNNRRGRTRAPRAARIVLWYGAMVSKISVFFPLLLFQRPGICRWWIIARGAGRPRVPARALDSNIIIYDVVRVTRLLLLVLL